MNSGGKTASGCWCKNANILRPGFLWLPWEHSVLGTWQLQRLQDLQGSELSVSFRPDRCCHIRLTNAIWRKERWGVRNRDVCLCAPRVLTTVFQCQVLLFTLLLRAEMGVEWGWRWTMPHPRGASPLFPKPVSFQTQAQCLWKCKVHSQTVSIFSDKGIASFSEKVKGKF